MSVSYWLPRSIYSELTTGSQFLTYCSCPTEGVSEEVEHSLGVVLRNEGILGVHDVGLVDVLGGPQRDVLDLGG